MYLLNYVDQSLKNKQSVYPLQKAGRKCSSGKKGKTILTLTPNVDHRFRL
jgi:hypothetical protein